MILSRLLAILLTSLVVIGISSCSTTPDLASTQPIDHRSWWEGDGVMGKPRIVINLTEQRLHYFKGDQLVGVSPISSGRESNATLNGKFRILDKDIDHRSSLYGCYVDQSGNMVVEDVDSRRDPRAPGAKFVGARMRYFMRIVGGIGMHEGYLPGYPASHGCIRLPTKMAAIFFEHTPQGTPVEVIGAGSLAVTEEAIPLSEQPIAAASLPSRLPESNERQRVKMQPEAVSLKVAVKPAESDSFSRIVIRRAILAEGRLAVPKRRLWQKSPPPGTTLYLE
ncbi:MAG: L,D-transpeptidase family protein [Verrucomicrobia bacterium]|nr:L,D-transpeptidase family protein [Verrucomicrobiota bacterium]